MNQDRRSQGTGGTQTAAICAAGQSYPPSTTRDETELWNGTSWTEVADVNTARQAQGGSCQGTTTAFLMFGGADPPRKAETEEWDGVSWTEVADLPAAISEHSGTGTASSALCMGGRITPSPTVRVDTLEWSNVAAIQTVAFD